MKLTENQRRAVNVVDGNYLVHASQGSGKTSSFIARIATLIKNEGVHPTNILGLTFTKEAANNMRVRLRKTVGDLLSSQVYLSTFHSFAYKIMKQNYPEYNNVTIIEPWLANQIANDIVKAKGGNNQDGHNLGINTGLFLDFVSYQKNHMVRYQDNILLDDNTSYVSHINRTTLQSAFDTYCKRMENAKKISFDDMLLDFYYKLESDSNLLDSLRDKYKYILVDEFQDTSVINLEILKLLENNNLYVIGDVDQSVYSFINAEVGNIINFIDDFENVEVISLPHNFRSTQKIIDVCNDLLKKYRDPDHPLNRFEKQISGREIDGDDVKVVVYNDEFIEARDIVEDIKRRKEADPSLEYKDFCIMSRTNNGLLAFENELSISEIPVTLSSGGSFYDRKEIDDLLSYAQLYVGEHDDAFRKVANRPNRYLANSMLRDLEEYAFNKNLSLEQAVEKGFDAGRYTTNLYRFLGTIEEIREIKQKNAEKILREIYYITNYKYFIQDKAMTNSEVIIKEDAINRLFESAKKFSSIQNFLNYVAVVKSNAKEEKDGVILSTAHSAKGLEWDVCYVVGVTDNNYPHAMLLSEDKDEELRLLFMALGRAKNHLQISLPVFEMGATKTYEPSRFIEPLLNDSLNEAWSEVISGKEKSEFYYEHKE